MRPGFPDGPSNRGSSGSVCVLTVREITDGKLPGLLCQISQGDIRLPFAYHEVDYDKRLEDNRPCRVPEAILKRTEDLRDTWLARMGGHQNVLNVLRLRSG